MRVGLDGFALHPLKLDPFGMLDFARRRGFQGLLFGWLGTDPGRLREIRAHADRSGLFSYVSVGSPNFHAYKVGVEECVCRLREEIERAAACGWHELGTNLGNEKTRFEDPRPWPEHEAAALQVLERLRPVLKGCQSRINLEPHGECGVFELIRLVEQVGPEYAGICLDTANVLCFAEDPVAAARRAAPYTHLTHLKDAIVYPAPRGLQRQVRPIGTGCLDWARILPLLAHHQPDLPLTIEDHKWLFEIPIFEPEWHRKVPGLPKEDLAETFRLALQVQERIRQGELEEPQAYEAVPYAEQLEERLATARDFLNKALAAR